MANELLKNSDTAAAKAETMNLPSTFQAGEIFMNIQAFESAQRMVKPLATSDLVPTTFQGKLGNCLIALEMAQRIGASPLMVMQNLYIVHGKPAWSSQFLVACINASRKFTPLRYKMTGEKGTDSYGCIAWAKDTEGEVLESPEVTIGMAKAEGWFQKSGSKWKTMPELMLRYRCATLFARLFAPELTMGIQTDDEVIDVTPVVTESRKSKFESNAEAITVQPIDEAAATAGNSPEVPPAPAPAPHLSDLEQLQKLLDEKGIPVSADRIKEYVESSGDFFSFSMVAPNVDAIAEAVLTKGE